MGLIDEHLERRRQTFGLRVAIGILVCYVASAVMSFSDIRYSLYGREVDAIIMKVEYKDMDNKVLVTYQFFSDEDKKWYKKTTSVGASNSSSSRR